MWAAVAMMLGIFAAEQSLSHSWLWLAALVGIFMSLWITFPQRIPWSGLVISLVGGLLTFKDTRVSSENDLRLLIGNSPRLVTLEGTIGSVPLMRAV